MLVISDALCFIVYNAVEVFNYINISTETWKGQIVLCEIVRVSEILNLFQMCLLAHLVPTSDACICMCFKT